MPIATRKNLDRTELIQALNGKILVDGKYLFTLKQPSPVVAIQCYDNHLLVAHTDLIHNYQLKPLQIVNKFQLEVKCMHYHDGLVYIGHSGGLSLGVLATNRLQQLSESKAEYIRNDGNDLIVGLLDGTHVKYSGTKLIGHVKYTPDVLLRNGAVYLKGKLKSLSQSVTDITPDLWVEYADGSVNQIDSKRVVLYQRKYPVVYDGNSVFVQGLTLTSQHELITTDIYRDKYVMVETSQTYMFGSLQSKQVSEVKLPGVDRLDFSEDYAVVYHSSTVFIIKFGQNYIYYENQSNGRVKLRGQSLLINNQVVDLDTFRTVEAQQASLTDNGHALQLANDQLLYLEHGQWDLLTQTDSYKVVGNAALADGRVWYDLDYPSVCIESSQVDPLLVQTFQLLCQKQYVNAYRLSNQAPVVQQLIVGQALDDLPSLRQIFQGKPEKLQLLDDIQLSSDYHKQAKQALLLDDFAKAEHVYLQNGKLDEAIGMYLSNNKWNEAFALVTSHKHPQQEQFKLKYIQWLKSNSHFERLADFVSEPEAYQLLIKAKRPDKASNLAIVQQDKKLQTQVLQQCLQLKMYDQAGALYVKLGDRRQALQSFMAGNCFEQALAVSEEPLDVHSKWALHLTKQNNFAEAAIHYQKAGQTQQAIDSLLRVFLWYDAFKLAQTIADYSISKKYVMVCADELALDNELQQAQECYVAVGEYQSALQMFLTKRKWHEAYEFAQTFIKDQSKIRELFKDYAYQKVDKKDIKSAVAILTALQDFDQLIALYLDIGQYQDAIDLVTKWCPQNLQQTQIFVARSYQAAGQIDQAAGWFVQAQAPREAIAMYCQLDKYEQAYILAIQVDSECVVQVAYLQARVTPDTVEALVRLRGLQLYEQVVEYALFIRDVVLPIRLVELNNIQDDLYRRVHHDFAQLLEDDGKFSLAELHFVKSGKPEEAIKMYVHLNDYEHAIQVAQQQVPNQVSSIVEGRIKSLLSENDHQGAEQLVVRYQCPEVLVDIYIKQNLWREVLMFVSDYAAQLLPEIFEQLAHFLGSTKATKDDIIRTAQTFESQGEFQKAIDVYLKASPKQVPVVTELGSVWMMAVAVQDDFDHERSAALSLVVAGKLQQIRVYDQAANLYIKAQDRSRAVDCLIAGHLWSRAKEAANGDPKLIKSIEQKQINIMKQKGQVEELINVDLHTALDLMAQRKDWTSCLEAARADPAVFEKYFTLYAMDRVQKDQIMELLTKYKLYGVPDSVQGKALLQEVLVRVFQSRHLPSLQLVKQLAVDQKYQQCAHLLGLLEIYGKKKDLTPLMWKIASSLLRFIPTTLPSGQVLHDAGLSSYNAGQQSLTYHIWSLLVDQLDGLDYVSELAPCFETKLTEITSRLPRDQEEQVREYVLKQSLSKLKFEIPKTTCNLCQQSMLPMAQQCPSCLYQHPTCIVTGFKLDSQQVECTACHSKANLNDWNQFIVINKICPWCSQPQKPKYGKS